MVLAVEQHGFHGNKLKPLGVFPVTKVLGCKKGSEKPFMTKTAPSQCDKLGDDTSHSTTKGKNIGWGPFTENVTKMFGKKKSL